MAAVVTALTALRKWLFTRVNGDEGVRVPGPQVPVEEFKRLYAHPAASGRSEGAALSDLFWYWLSPGPELHQEHLEAGPAYEATAQCTRQILAAARESAAALARQSAARVLGTAAGPAKVGPAVVRLRDLAMPLWADFYYTVVFGEPAPSAARALIVANARDVVDALKNVSLRHMRVRAMLTKDDAKYITFYMTH